MNECPTTISRANELRTIYSILDYARGNAEKIGAHKLAKAIADAMRTATYEIADLTPGAKPLN